MTKVFNWISGILGIAGGAIVYFVGGFDNILLTLLILIAVDYITGIMKAVFTKTLSSKIGFKGIVSKICIVICVGVAFILSTAISTDIAIREIVIMFFIVNESISILENLSEFIPIPAKLKELLLQMRDKKDG